ncbi:TPA: hypothetical protein DEP30_02075 [Candidatus Nomurabacteria bacterium]|nr:MAG: hypothetical protein UR97_C0001G0011 [Candidatus Nomurabacteria bacterium GW2011_GWE2_36_115]KKP94313.1 MAG: hypothetical protein US00_C0002G0009 [Candidatus Nomurabacteria bacterium GW2011_GWF2_36_126]KKP96860.1 MAG: hypothetical protein US04_C0001G0363 [Candidatus Nomurabacteria bacterium GW2011_GWD2_36_14]KKP99536.1 MAG: hypothetical protein US08_C0001G0218 [Candidatus Nomurabacteria bacterium GW2011_GWF2_36_19]KKQ05531.1 MAG: hypothetical protein US17_C0003G0010 [Candidatus Nomuraba
MKKLLVGLFIFGFLSVGIGQVHASVLSDTLLKIQNLQREIASLKISLKGSVADIPQPPTLGTTTVSNFTSTGVTISSSVVSLGYPALLIARGTCYGLETQGPMSNCLNDAGKTTGPFSQNRTGLTPNTKYLAISYAINDTATNWSNTVSFTTPASVTPVPGGWTDWTNSGSCTSNGQTQVRYCTNPAPLNGGSCEGLATQQVSCAYSSVPTVSYPTSQSITENRAMLGATVTSNGYPLTILENGVCYSASISAPSKTNGATCVKSASQQTLVYATSLTPNTTYKFRGYATNATGTGYSPEGTFTTLGGVVDSNYAYTYPYSNEGEFRGKLVNNGQSNIGGIFNYNGATVWFEYGVYSNLPNSSKANVSNSSISMSGDFTYQFDIKTLLPNTKYSYRACVAATSLSTGQGSISSPFCGSTSSFTTPASVSPSITLLSPNGGEQYTVGQQITVKYKMTNNDSQVGDTVSVFLKNAYSDTYNFGSFRAEVVGDDSITLTIPSNSNLSNGYKILVKFNGPAGYVSQDESDNTFSIRASSTTPSVPVVSNPLATSVTQTSAVLGANVILMGYPVSNSSIGYIYYGKTPRPSTPVKGTDYTISTDFYNVSVTGLTCGTKYYFYGALSNTVGTGYTSDGTFTTLPCGTTTPSITVLSPNGGEVYKVGDKIEVKWKSSNLDANEKIRISLSGLFDNGNTAKGCDLNNSSLLSTNDGYELVTIKNDDYSIKNCTPQSGKYYKIGIIQQASYDGQNVAGDNSDSSFTIKSNESVMCPSNSSPFITVATPNGGEAFTTGQQITVGWSTCNISGTGVYAYLTDQSGVSFPLAGFTKNTDGSKVANTVLNTGIYTFITDKIVGYDGLKDILAIGSKKFKISISDYKGISDESNNYFTINSSSTNTCPTYVAPVSCGAYQTEAVKDASGCIVKYQCTGASKSADVSAGSDNTVDAEDLAKINRTLRQGTRGDDVKILQAFLGIDADGIFGRGTANKVKAWQAEHKIRSDGFFGRGSLMTATADLQ